MEKPKLSKEQKEELINFLDAAENKSEAARQFVEQHNLSFKPEALVQKYLYFKRKTNGNTSKKQKPTQVPQSKLPTGFSLMQTILSSNIELTPNSKITITPTELHIQF